MESDYQCMPLEARSEAESHVRLEAVRHTERSALGRWQRVQIADVDVDVRGAGTFRFRCDKLARLRARAFTNSLIAHANTPVTRLKI